MRQIIRKTLLTKTSHFNVKNIIRDKKFLKFLHDVGVCCNLTMGLLCRGDIVAHHENEEMKGVMGGKVGDNQSIPLCHECHSRRHNKGRKAFWGERKPLELAEKLWHIWTLNSHESYQWKLDEARRVVIKWRATGE